MRSFKYLALFAGVVLASPTKSIFEGIPHKRDAAASSTITSASQLDSIVTGLEEDGAELSAGASVLMNGTSVPILAILSCECSGGREPSSRSMQTMQHDQKNLLNFEAPPSFRQAHAKEVIVVEAIVPAPAPSNIPALISSVASVYAAHPTDFLVSALDLVVDGLAPKDLVEDGLAESPLENSSSNLNLISPTQAVYPKKGTDDAPYSVSEETLRSAIYIPLKFTYGKVPPVIFIPGTGATGGENYGANFGKLFAGSDYADPVYLNIPGAQLNDIQVNSEYIAYAINYISAISSNKNVSLLSWSAGSVGTAWAFTYWPSTRSVVSNDIVISGDYHGTVLAHLLCPGFPQLPCAPSVIQVSP